MYVLLELAKPKTVHFSSGHRHNCGNQRCCLMCFKGINICLMRPLNDCYMLVFWLQLVNATSLWQKNLMQIILPSFLFKPREHWTHCCCISGCFSVLYCVLHLPHLYRMFLLVRFVGEFLAFTHFYCKCLFRVWHDRWNLSDRFSDNVMK